MAVAARKGSCDRPPRFPRQFFDPLRRRPGAAGPRHGNRAHLLGHAAPLCLGALYPAVFVAALIGELWGGVAATLLATALAGFYLVPAQVAEAPPEAALGVQMAIFAATGILFSVFSHRLSQKERLAERPRRQPSPPQAVRAVPGRDRLSRRQGPLPGRQSGFLRTDRLHPGRTPGAGCLPRRRWGRSRPSARLPGQCPGRPTGSPPAGACAAGTVSRRRWRPSSPARAMEAPWPWSTTSASACITSRICTRPIPSARRCWTRFPPRWP